MSRTRRRAVTRTIRFASGQRLRSAAADLVGERQVLLDERPVLADFLFEAAHLAFVKGEVDERDQDFVHPVGRAEHERAAGAPEDAVVAERQVNRLDGERVAGRRLHPVLAALLLLVRGVRRAAGQEEKMEFVQRLGRVGRGRKLVERDRLRDGDAVVRIAEPGEDFRARRRGGRNRMRKRRGRLRIADCGLRM